MRQSPSHSLCLTGTLDLINMRYIGADSLKEKSWGLPELQRCGHVLVHHIWSLFLCWKNSLLINLGEKSPPHPKDTETHEIASPAVLEPEHCHGTKASQPEASPCLGFSEVPMAPQPQTSYRENVAWMDRRSLQISGIIQRTLSRSDDSSLLPNVILSYSPAPSPKRCLVKGKAWADPTQGRALDWQWRLLDSVFQALDNAPGQRLEGTWNFIPIPMVLNVLRRQHFEAVSD